MSADTLRRAAALMRERAEAAADDLHEPATDPLTWRGIGTGYREPIKDHIASWHPAVALAVADWLDCVAAPFDQMWEADEDGVLWGYDLDGDSLRFDESQDSLALAVARTYLGESA